MSNRISQLTETQFKAWHARSHRTIPRRPRVLVVDNEPRARALHAELLRREGCEVEETADGESALMKLAFRYFDLLVTDWRMPRLDGASLVLWLRASCNAMPVVMISNCDAHELPAAMRRELHALLPKPVVPGRFVDVVREVLGLPAAESAPSAAPLSAFAMA
jgi:CheY-like chemotaxis protein